MVTATRSGQVWSALVAVYLIWGSTYLGTALLVQSMPTLSSSGLRFALAGILLATTLMLVRGPRALRVTRRQLASSAAMGVGFLAVSIGILASAVHHVPTGVAAIIVSSIPLWIAIIRAITGDRPSLLTLAGVLVGMAGLVVLLLPGDGNASFGSIGFLWSLAMVASSVSWSFLTWLSPRVPTAPDGLVNVTFQLLAAGATLTLLGLATGERWDLGAVTARSWIALAYMVVIGSILGYGAFTWLVAHAPTSLVATYAYVNPVVAVILGVLLLGETVTHGIVVGSAIVLGGVVLVVSGERRTPVRP